MTLDSPSRPRTLAPMEVTLLLADAARAHGDGTVSLLRGGIDRVVSDREDGIGFKASLVVRIRGDVGDAGPHLACVQLISDGEPRRIFHTPSQEFQFPDQGGAYMLVADLAIQFPRRGAYRFEALVDDEVRATWPISVGGPPSNRDSGGGQ